MEEGVHEWSFRSYQYTLGGEGGVGEGGREGGRKGGGRKHVGSCHMYMYMYMYVGGVR